MPTNKPARYLLFGTLYFAQGSILAYFTALNALYLLSFNLTMSQVGIFSAIALLPFVLKIFFGMLSDKVSLLGRGHRKPYIVLGLLIQATGLVIAPLIHPGQFFWEFALLAFVLMSGMALYDTCTDGLALDTTPPDEQGTIQGFMVGGRALGVVAISAVIGVLAQHTGWTVAFWSLAVITLLPLPLIWAVREGTRPAERQFRWSAFRAFSRRPLIALALFGMIYSLAINAANEIVNPFLEHDFGISLTAAGFYTAVWGIGVALGGLTGGRLTDRIGRRRAALGAMGIAAVGTAALALIGSPRMAWPLVLLFGLGFGYYETVYFATAMSFTDPHIAASMYSILMAVANIGIGVGLAVSGALVDAVGYRATFAVVAAVHLLALPLLPTIFGKQRQQMLRPTS
jgi:PAT family beta-lactamase induction signal transducer AmpG